MASIDWLWEFIIILFDDWDLRGIRYASWHTSTTRTTCSLWQPKSISGQCPQMQNLALCSFIWVIQCTANICACFLPIHHLHVLVLWILWCDSPWGICNIQDWKNCAFVPRKMQQFIMMVNQHEPRIWNVIGFLDGVSFMSECTSKYATQNAIYCDYKCNTTINNVFAYRPDGKFFMHWTFLGVGQMVAWLQDSYLLSIRRLAAIRYVLIWVFQSGSACYVFIGTINNWTARWLHCWLQE